MMRRDLSRVAGEYAARRERAKDYDPYSLFHRGHLFAIQSRQREVLRLLRKEEFFPLTGKNILEVGCGKGNVLREFLSFGAEPAKLHGVDLLPWICRDAKALSPNILISCSDGQYLPYPPNTFDLILQFTMFTSILDAEIKETIAKEMRMILKPSGLILWYDFWLNPTNRQTRGIRKKEIKALFPLSDIYMKKITLAPPIARRIAKISWIACEALESLRIFNSHYLALIRPNSV